MGWRGPTLTDSGGYQVFSLAAIRRIDDAGVLFQNHYDGAELHLTPERCMRLQKSIGADIVMALDECPPGGAPREAVRAATERTHRWAERCRAAWDPAGGQALFGIVQGGTHADLRAESAARIAGLDFPGNAIGGVSVGEAPEAMRRVVAETAPLLPEAKPRYLMGVGRPEDLLHGIDRGIDLFDCVMPTRHARHGQAFTADGTLNLKNARFRLDGEPIEPGCDCPACVGVSRAYLRHLLQVGEMLAPVLLTMHNLRHYLRLMEDARAAIRAGRWGAFHDERMGRLGAAESPLREPS
jgi:queuine tRNA-ribosyltransferase